MNIVQMASTGTTRGSYGLQLSIMSLDFLIMCMYKNSVPALPDEIINFHSGLSINLGA